MKILIGLFSILLTSPAFTQNTGIGTTTPETKLHVVDSTGDATTRIETTLSSNLSQLQLKTKNGFYDFLQLQKWPQGASGTIGGINLNNLSTVLAGVNAGALVIGTQTSSHLHLFTDNTERVRITSTGNVGIGILSPTQKLEVAGTIGATGYNLSSPKTYYYSLSGADFSAIIGSDVERREEISGGGIAMETGNSGIVAPVHLPHGAVVTRMTLYYYDLSSSVNVDLRLRPNSSIIPLAVLSSSGSSGNNSATTTSISNSTIDNTIYAYVIDAIPTGNWPNYDLIVRRVTIEYTLSGL